MDSYCGAQVNLDYTGELWPGGWQPVFVTKWNAYIYLFMYDLWLLSPYSVRAEHSSEFKPQVFPVWPFRKTFAHPPQILAIVHALLYPGCVVLFLSAHTAAHSLPPPSAPPTHRARRRLRTLCTWALYFGARSPHLASLLSLAKKGK